MTTPSAQNAWHAYQELQERVKEPESDFTVPLNVHRRMAKLLTRVHPRTRELFLRLHSVLSSIRDADGLIRVYEWNALIACAGKTRRKTKLEDYKEALNVFGDMVAFMPLLTEPHCCLLRLLLPWPPCSASLQSWYFCLPTPDGPTIQQPVPHSVKLTTTPTCDEHFHTVIRNGPVGNKGGYYGLQHNTRVCDGYTPGVHPVSILLLMVHTKIARKRYAMLLVSYQNWWCVLDLFRPWTLLVRSRSKPDLI